MRFDDLLHLIAFSGKAHGEPPAFGLVITKMPDAPAPSQATSRPNLGPYIPLSAPRKAKPSRPSAAGLATRAGCGKTARSCAGAGIRMVRQDRPRVGASPPSTFMSASAGCEKMVLQCAGAASPTDGTFRRRVRRSRPSALVSITSAGCEKMVLQCAGAASPTGGTFRRRVRRSRPSALV